MVKVTGWKKSKVNPHSRTLEIVCLVLSIALEVVLIARGNAGSASLIMGTIKKCIV